MQGFEQSTSTSGDSTKSSLNTELQTALLDSRAPNPLKDHILNPAYNAGIATPYNALANAGNALARSVSGESLLPKLDLAEQKHEAVLTPGWALQNISSGLAAAVPYLISGRIASSGLRFGANTLALEGTAARVAASELTGMLAGAAMLDGWRDLRGTESTAGNIAAGITTFGVLGGANLLTRELGTFSKTATRFAIGSAGAVAGLTVSDVLSQKQFPDAQRLAESMLSGGFMNAILPAAQTRIGQAANQIESKLTGSMPISEFIKEHRLSPTKDAPLSASLDLFAPKLPLMKVRTTDGDGSKNVISMDKPLLDSLKNAKGTELEIARGQAARYLGEQLASRFRSRQGIPEGVLSNNGIELAMRQGRLEVFERGADGKEYKVYRPENIGNNTLDVHLDSQFNIIPKSGLIDFRSTTPKEVLKSWPTSEHPNGITLQPGDAVLAMTREKIHMPSGPKPEWHGHPALIGDINSPSQIGRMFIEVHQTAPVLNSGTNNRITLEIVNNNPNPLHLVPGMRIASIVFRTVSGHPEGTLQRSSMHGQEQPNGLQQSATTSRADLQLAK